MVPEMYRSLEASAETSAYQIVAFSNPGAGKLIAPASSNRQPLVGAVGKVGGSTGTLVDVAIAGVPGVRLGGVVAAGDPLTSDSAGRAVTATDGSYIIGFAQEPGAADAVIDYIASPGVYRSGDISLPVSFGWALDRYPVRIYRTGRALFGSDFSAREDVPAIKAIFDGVDAGTTQIVYADARKADDSGNALTLATAKRSARSAIVAAEAVAGKTATLLYVWAGEYDRTLDFLNTSSAGGTAPTRPLATVAIGGQVNMGPFMLGLAWAPDGAGYSVTRQAFARMTNRLARDKYGKEVPFTWFATKDAALASVGVDACFFDAATFLLTVKRADGAAPNDTNTRVLLGANSCSPGGVPFYAQGIDFMGGQSGTLQRNNLAAVTPIALEDCALLYPGYEITDLGNGAAVDYPGLCVLVRPHIAYTRRDAVSPNGANCPDVNNRMHVLVIGGRSYMIGSRSLSCNITTGHGNDVLTSAGGTGMGIRLIEIGHEGELSAGGARRYVHASKGLVFAGRTNGDRGDVAAGGTTPSMGIAAEDFAEVWAYEHGLSGTEIAVSTTVNGRVHLRGCELGGGRVIRNGLVDTF